MTPAAPPRAPSTVQDPLDYLAEYRARRARQRPGGGPHESGAIEAAIAFLRPYPRPTQGQIAHLLGGCPESVRQAQSAIFSALGWRTRFHARPPNWPPDCDPVAALASQLCPLPLTCLDPNLFEQIARPSDSHCARILALSDPRIRRTAAVNLFLGAARASNRKRITQQIKGWELLDAWLVRMDWADDPLGSPARIPEALLAWLAEDPTRARLDYWTLLATASRDVEHCLATHPEVAASLDGKCVRIPLVRGYQAARAIQRAADEGARRRRAGTADPIADHYPEIIRMVDERFAEIADVRDQFEKACATLARHPAQQQLQFAVELAPLSGGVASGNRILDFAAWKSTALERRFGPAAGAPPGPPAALFHLAFLGMRDPENADDGLPILEAYRRGLFVSPGCRTAEQERALREWMANGEPPPELVVLRPFRYAGRGDRRLADVAFAGGMTLIPIAALHHGLAIGRAVARSGLISGGRIAEILQQCHLAEADLHQREPGAFGYTANGQYYYLARPKGREQIERFYIDGETLAAITEVIEIAARNGSSVRPVRRLTQDCAIRSRIYQLGGRCLTQAEINACLRMILLGYPLRSHDLRHAFGRFCRAEGLGQKNIQAVLHHDCEATTAIYTPSTERRKADLARKLAARVHSRSRKRGGGR